MARSCRVKAEVVAQDEREADLRAILNFGHSLAHLIETHTGYETVLHGEAVGAGMLFAAFASHDWGGLDSYEFGRIRDLLLPLMQTIDMPPLDEATFTRLLMHDKKAGSGTLKFIALDGLGHAVIRRSLPSPGKVGISRGGPAPAELWRLLQAFLRELPQVLHVATA